MTVLIIFKTKVRAQEESDDSKKRQKEESVKKHKQMVAATVKNAIDAFEIQQNKVEMECEKKNKEVLPIKSRNPQIGRT
uniref:Remorin_C domain-containing protein n=1 Tax=Rhabditophanes sp. KR3021 TaxID=114890 RepID=A0AC35TQB1_9BILA